MEHGQNIKADAISAQVSVANNVIGTQTPATFLPENLLQTPDFSPEYLPSVSRVKPKKSTLTYFNPNCDLFQSLSK